MNWGGVPYHPAESPESHTTRVMPTPVISFEQSPQGLNVT